MGVKGGRVRTGGVKSGGYEGVCAISNGKNTSDRHEGSDGAKGDGRNVACDEAEDDDEAMLAGGVTNVSK